MTIREIEETIHTLETRHPGLNEVMLLTLLKAGGWEEKDIQTAKTLFGSSSGKNASQIPSVSSSPAPAPPQPSAIPPSQKEKEESVSIKSFAPVQDVPLFTPAVDESHLVEAPHEERVEVPLTPLATEGPVSLMSKVEIPTSSGKEDLPHNLPLRPFETSEHIWPFARYRDVFYGEEHVDPVPVQPGESKRQASPVQPMIAPTQVVVNINPTSEKPAPVASTPIPEPVVASPPVPPAREPVFVAPMGVEKKVVIVEKTGDEKLVIMACVMLLAILLLLGYMYSNGRL